MYHLLITVALVWVLAACQKTPTEQAQAQVAAANQNAESAAAEGEESKLVKKLPCQIKKSPPIKDKSKIKEMLINSGKISAEMSEEKAMQIVNDYIRKKQTAKECKK